MFIESSVVVKGGVLSQIEWRSDVGMSGYRRKRKSNGRK